MTTKKILMFGGKGCGKSSVLAAIYDQAVAITNNLDLNIVLDDENAIPLLNKKLQIRHFCDMINEARPTNEIPRIPNVEAESYKIDLGIKNEPPLISLEFIDTAGGWLTTPEGHRRLSNLLGQCQAAILAIDAVELLQGRDHVPANPNECRNLPEHVRQQVAKWIQSSPNTPRFLCIVPVKTETYIRERQGHDHNLGGESLINAVESSFRTTFELLASNNNIAVAITPVQTMGNVIFDHYEEPLSPGEYPREFWRRITSTRTPTQMPRGYDPRDCEQPLRYILNFFLVQQIRAETQKSGWHRTIIDWLKWFDIIGSNSEKWLSNFITTYEDFFGNRQVLISAVWKFGAETKNTSPFKLIQGKPLMERDENLLTQFDNWLKSKP